MNIIIFYQGNRLQRDKIIDKLRKSQMWFGFHMNDESKIIVEDSNITLTNRDTCIKFMYLSDKAIGYRADLLLIPRSMKGTEDVGRYVLPMAKGLVYYYEEDEE